MKYKDLRVSTKRKPSYFIRAKDKKKVPQVFEKDDPKFRYCPSIIPNLNNVVYFDPLDDVIPVEIEIRRLEK